MKRILICLLCFVLFLWVGTMTLLAAPQAKPAVAPAGPGFSADVAGVQDGTPVTGKMYHMPQRLRMEQLSGTTQTILILDQKKKLLWIISPADKTYSEFDLSSPGVTLNMPFPDETSKPCATMKATSCTRAGQETVNGRRCNRWLVSAPNGDKTLKTTIWLDPTLGAPIRWLNDSGDHYDVTNVKVGPQPDSLFQVPAGFKKN